jgi:hypothetical protein
MRERFGTHQLTQTPLGGRVICGERDLLYEEAPAAYKNIEDGVQDLVDARLVSVIATFRPLLTYKTRRCSRCKSSITPRDGVCAGANPVGHPNSQRRLGGRIVENAPCATEGLKV